MKNKRFITVRIKKKEYNWVNISSITVWRYHFVKIPPGHPVRIVVIVAKRYNARAVLNGNAVYGNTHDVYYNST